MLMRHAIVAGGSGALCVFPWDTLRDRVQKFLHLVDDRHIVGTFVLRVGPDGAAERRRRLSRCSRHVGTRGCAALSSVRVVAAASAALPFGDRGLRFSSQPIVRLRVLKDSTSFSTEADSAPDVIGTKELSSAPQVFDADARSSVVLWVLSVLSVLSVDDLSHPS